MRKSFKGLMADGEQETIRLSTNNGLTGYKIVKFEIMGVDADENIESTVKVHSTKRPMPVDVIINFNDPTLLAAATLESNVSSNYPTDRIIIFDNTVFNQDIFITLKGSGYTASINWYLELEQMPLDLSEATVATLKDMRGTE